MLVKHDPYVNLFRQEDVDSITGKTTETIGLNTDQKSKAYAIDTLKKDLKSGSCIPRAYSTYGESRVFIHGERSKRSDRPVLANITPHQGPTRSSSREYCQLGGSLSS